jgi:hypothetical protein
VQDEGLSNGSKVQVGLMSGMLWLLEKVRMVKFYSLDEFIMKTL